MKNKKGFTLIELLAVIIILGILMIIAIPSVTKYISDSRKSAYIDTAKEIVSGTRNVVNEGKLEMYSTNTTYYIPVGYIKTENATKSPYGDFVKDASYVAVIYNGTGYKYFWISVDDAGEGVRKIVPYDKLEIDDIESDINPEDIKYIVGHTGIGERTEIRILNDNGTWGEAHIADNHVSESGGVPSGSGSGESGSSVVVYPTGKTKETVVTGDIVKIGEEEFYVVKRDGNDLILLARYNLKVGSIYNYADYSAGMPAYPTYNRDYSSVDNKYGLQNSDDLTNAFKGVVAFSSTTYWVGQVGYGLKYSGVICSNINETNCAYVYDENSLIYPYINNYKEYLIGLGCNIKEARLMSLDEANSFKETNLSEFSEMPYWWLGTATEYYSSNSVWRVHGNSIVNSYSPSGNVYGVRPVIVI